jgi:hypothetical protein
MTWLVRICVVGFRKELHIYHPWPLTGEVNQTLDCREARLEGSLSSTGPTTHWPGLLIKAFLNSVWTSSAGRTLPENSVQSMGDMTSRTEGGVRYKKAFMISELHTETLQLWRADVDSDQDPGDLRPAYIYLLAMYQRGMGPTFRTCFQPNWCY